MKILKKLPVLLLSFALLFSLFAVTASAEEAADTSLTLETEEALETEADTPAALEALVGFLEQNASEILGALTLLASLIVAFLYKSGLLPLLRNGLSVLADTAGKTGKMTEVFTERAEAELTALRESLAPYTELLAKSEEYLRTVSEAMVSAERKTRETRDILAAETALFYELLSSVNLPEAQKESMAQSYYKLKKRLEDEE